MLYALLRCLFHMLPLPSLTILTDNMCPIYSKSTSNSYRAAQEFPSRRKSMPTQWRSGGTISPSNKSSNSNMNSTATATVTV